MTGSIFHLAISTGLFVGLHLFLSSRTVRRPLIGRLGKWGFTGVFAAISAALLTWSISAYLAAPLVGLYEPNTAMRHASLSLMLFAAFFVVAGYTTPNPGIVGMETRGLQSGARGILKITRHPAMWGVALWGISHILGNGHLAALIFFGGFIILALAGAAHIDAKRRAKHGADWQAFEDATSFWPMGAILAGRTRMERGDIRWWQSLLSIALYIGMLWMHARMGRDVFPMAFF